MTPAEIIALGIDAYACGLSSPEEAVQETLKALREAGLKIVGREPSEEMLRSGNKAAAEEQLVHWDRRPVGKIWREMWDKA